MGRRSAETAAGALMFVALHSDSNVVDAVRMEVRSRLVQLLGLGTPVHEQSNALGALIRLPESTQNGVSLAAAAGVVPRLVQLLGPGSPAQVRGNAAGALASLARDAEGVAMIVEGGAVPALSHAGSAAWLSCSSCAAERSKGTALHPPVDAAGSLNVVAGHSLESAAGDGANSELSSES